MALTKDETKRIIDATDALQSELDKFNPEAEATQSLQANVTLIRELLGVKVEAAPADDETPDDEEDSGN